MTHTHTHTHTHTFCQILYGLPHATVEGARVSRALEGQAALPVVHLPVVERGRGLGVDQVLLQEALQNHLVGGGWSINNWYQHTGGVTEVSS